MGGGGSGDEGVEDINPTNLINKAMTSLLVLQVFFKLDNVAKAAVRNLMLTKDHSLKRVLKNKISS